MISQQPFVPSARIQLRFAKPIIGIVGGIGSGKSFVARLFGEMGCLVIDSDTQVREAYELPKVREALHRWWGDSVFQADGSIDRPTIARRIFADPDHEANRHMLEGLLHPIVARMRDEKMAAVANDVNVLAYVWDTPLLLETGLGDSCDALVYVEAPREVRQARVAQKRGWDDTELARRENLQWPLDKKREISDHVVTNTADADVVRGQVRQVVSRILARSLNGPGLQ
jgi:dephospho-CoA kinase